MISKSILKSCHHQGFREREVFDAYKIFFGTLVSESRLKIINLLRKNELSVSDIVAMLGIDQTAVSHDLSKLKLCGFVFSTVRGKYRYYALNERTIKPLMELIDNHMQKHCMHILLAMRGEKHE